MCIFKLLHYVWVFVFRKFPELLQQFKYLLGYKEHGSMDPFAGLSGISSLLAAKDRTSEYSPEIGQ